MRVRIGDVRLFVEVLGREWIFDGERMRRRPVLVGLHGGPGVDATTLRHHLASLAEVAQVVVPDQRGHGRSDRGSPASWTLETWAEDLEAFREVLGLDRPIVLGISFGGFVAQRYAADHPAELQGLVLISTAARFAPPDELVARFGAVGGEEAASAMRRSLDAPSRASGAEWMRVCRPLLSWRRDEDSWLAGLEAQAIQTMDVNDEFMPRAHEVDLRPALRAVRCPTLVLVGAHDPLVPAEHAREVVDAIPKGLARLEVIQNASHRVFSDAPDEVLRLIRDFVGSVA